MTQAQHPGDASPGSNAPQDDTHPLGDPDEGAGFGAGIEDSGSTTRGAPRKTRARAATRKKAPKTARKTVPKRDPEKAPEKPRKRAQTRVRGKTQRTIARKSAAPPEPTDGRQPAAAGPSDEARSGSPAAEPDEAKRRRRRGSRGGRRRRRKSPAEPGLGVDALPGEEDDLPGTPPGDGGETTAKKARKRSRRRRAGRGDGDAEGDGEAQGGAAAQENRRKAARKAGTKKAGKKATGRTTARKKTSTRKKGTKKRESARRTKPAEKTSESATPQRDQLILVNAADKEEKRVAVVEGHRIVDLLMTSESQKTLVNDIYRGRVVNLEPAIGAAFVDFGQGRNGFLHTSDVLGIYGEKGFRLDWLLTRKVDPEEWDGDGGPAAEAVDVVGDDDPKEASGDGPQKGQTRRKGRRRARERRPITELLKVGDPVVVQVTKDAIGDKGPTLTTYVSIPGRYLVLMPSMSHTGVSRKIPDEKERRRLKRILTALDAPPDMGVIVRTAGVGKTKVDLQRDLHYLLGVWEAFGKRLESGRGPVPLYQESDVATRTLRDLFSARTMEVIIDDHEVHEQLVEFANKLMPEHVDLIKKHDGERPIFHHNGIEQDFERVFSRRVDLPSGGSIVFDQAEALVAIDVNSGRTRTDSFDFEEVALKTNLEAVPEIVRQIRLRDLGGILVCDFIDMMRSSSNRAVERALRTEMAGDRARSKLGRISQFGLLEMTRQRLGPGTHKKVFETCPRCRGTGRIRSVESRAQAIVRRLGSALVQKGFTTVEVRAHPEVIEYLREDFWDYLRALEHRFDKELELTPVPDQPEDSVLRYLRADGREVRPGGRRKR